MKTLSSDAYGRPLARLMQAGVFVAAGVVAIAKIDDPPFNFVVGAIFWLGGLAGYLYARGFHAAALQDECIIFTGKGHVVHLPLSQVSAVQVGPTSHPAVVVTLKQDTPLGRRIKFMPKGVEEARSLLELAAKTRDATCSHQSQS